MYFYSDLIFTLPELYLLTLGSLMLVYSVWYSSSAGYDYPVMSQNTGYLVLLIFLMMMVLCFESFSGMPFNTTWMESLKSDFFSYSFMMGVLITSSLVICLSSELRLPTKSSKSVQFEYYLLILFSTLGALLMVKSNNLMSFYLSLEMMSLPLFGLVCTQKSLGSTEAGLKYFILGAFSSGFMLFGISLIFMEIGSLEFGLFKLSSFDSMYAQLGITFLLVGFLFKMAAFPFHTWAPDLYEGANLMVVLLITTLPKIAIFSVALKLFILNNFMNSVPTFLVLSSFGSMAVGTFGAMLQQFNMKRFFAFSAVSNSGILLMGLVSNSIESVQAVIMYLIIYMSMNIVAFSILKIVQSGDVDKPLGFEAFKGLSKTNSVLAITIGLLFFSLAGTPPLAGFISKVYLFYVVIANEYYGLATWGILFTVVSAYYYIKIIKITYFEDTYAIWSLSESTKLVYYTISTLMMFLTLFILWPTPLLTFMSEASLALTS